MSLNEIHRSRLDFESNGWARAVVAVIVVQYCPVCVYVRVCVRSNVDILNSARSKRFSISSLLSSPMFYTGVLHGEFFCFVCLSLTVQSSSFECCDQLLF